MGSPPSEAGAVHVRRTLWLRGIAATDKGALGTSNAEPCVVAFSPIPRSDCACTRTWRRSPVGTLETIALVAAALVFTTSDHGPAVDVEDHTRYPVMADPPFEAGADHETWIWPAPGPLTAEMAVGSLGSASSGPGVVSTGSAVY